METKEMLGKVEEFADRAHGNQLRKYTAERYIVHPVRVMQICRSYNNSPAVLAAALLHDVLEDTPVSENEMSRFLGSLMENHMRDRTVQLVVELTDVYTHASFPEWNRRKRKEMEAARIAATSADAQTIKYADLIDNSTEIAAHDPGFSTRFLREAQAILLVADRGDSALRTQAINLVTSQLSGLSR